MIVRAAAPDDVPALEGLWQAFEDEVPSPPHVDVRRDARARGAAGDRRLRGSSSSRRTTASRSATRWRGAPARASGGSPTSMSCRTRGVEAWPRHSSTRWSRRSPQTASSTSTSRCSHPTQVPGPCTTAGASARTSSCWGRRWQPSASASRRAGTPCRSRRSTSRPTPSETSSGRRGTSLPGSAPAARASRGRGTAG